MSSYASISPPFIEVPGVPNFRDIGGYPISASPGKIVKPGIVFRSSEPSQATEEGVVKLRELGVKNVYDFRSELELVRDAQKGNGRQVKTWDGATRVVASVFSDYDYTSEGITQRFNRYSADTSTPIVLTHLREILAAAAAPENPKQPYSTILQHLASTSTSDPSPIMVHCAAGKDRTGVICALILSLCGVEDEIVAHEFSLSELGLKLRPEFLKHLMQDPILKGNAPIAMQMVGSRKRIMVEFLKTIKEKWGSVDQCVVGLGLLSQEGIEQLRRNMTINDAGMSEAKVDWKPHAELVAKAEEEADARIAIALGQA